MWQYLSDIFIVLLIVGAIAFYIFNRRNKMLKLWGEVSRLELDFHKSLFETADAFSQHADLFDHFDHLEYLKDLTKEGSPKIRTLSLEERRAVYKALQTLYVSMDDDEQETHLTLKKQFEDLQSRRLIYNSKVLYYNHFIQSFPMRYLRKKMGFEEKDYFG